MFTQTKDETAWSHVVNVINQFGKPSVLFFFFLSGFVFASFEAKLYKNIRFFWVTRFLRIIPPYLLVSALGLLFTGGLWKNYWGNLLNGQNFFHLYFIPLILLLYLLYPLLRKIRFNKKILLVLLLLALATSVFSILSGVVPLLSETMIFVEVLHHDFFLDNYRIYFLWQEYIAYGIFFFSVGIYLAQNKRKTLLPWSWLQRIVFFSVAFVLVLSEYYWYVTEGLSPDSASRIWRPIVLVYGLAYIIVFSGFQQKDSPPWLRQMSKASFLVYLLHPFYLRLCYKLMPGYYFEFRYFLITISLSWATALAALKLAQYSQVWGLLCGEGHHILVKKLQEIYRKIKQLSRT